MANGTFSMLVIRTVDILGDVEELEIPQPSEREITELDKHPDIPFWFDNEIGWNISDFTNPEIYQSVTLYGK